MTDTHIDDIFTYNLAGVAYNKAEAALAMLKRVQEMGNEIAQVTDAETPDLEDSIVTAEALTADISEAIDNWEQAA